jgi:hypothetical protein
MARRASFYVSNRTLTREIESVADCPDAVHANRQRAFR